MHRIEEFMRGSIIKYRVTKKTSKDYLKIKSTVVWGTTTDENSRDVLEIGLHGSGGYIDIADVIGEELTEAILEAYGFLKINNGSDIVTWYRDDFGYLKLDTYGVKHMYIGGEPIKYLHNFQRIFFDYKGKPLTVKKSEPPKKEFISSLIKPKDTSVSSAASSLERLENITNINVDKLKFNIPAKEK